LCDDDGLHRVNIGIKIANDLSLINNNDQAIADLLTHPDIAALVFPSLRKRKEGGSNLFFPSLFIRRKERGGPAQRRPGE
jgi:hypothetical protein